MSIRPVAVLISDIHFTPATLELAAASLLKAQFRAALLKIPLVICGDTLDSKAIMRAECVNKLIELLTVKDAPDTIVLVGNHDMINEKGKEHSLNFLKPYCTVVDSPQNRFLNGLQVLMLPYQVNPDDVRAILKANYEDPDVEKPDLTIMHQGIEGSNSGEYIQDKSAINHFDVANYRVISGHYHSRQDIKTGRPQKGAKGMFSYVGNPYTLNFAEANDPEKGYQVLMNNGTLEFVPTKLRNHVIFDLELREGEGIPIIIAGPTSDKMHSDDIVKVNLSGTKDRLAKITKADIERRLGISVRLDLIPTDDSRKTDAIILASKPELLDSLIDATSAGDETKVRLKSTWRGLCE